MNEGVSATHLTRDSTTARPDQIAWSRLGIAVFVAVIMSSVLNTLLGLGAVQLFGIPATFEPLTGWAAAQSSAIAALGAGVVLALLTRFTSRPIFWFWRISTVVFVLTLGPVLGLALADTPGGSAAAYGTLVAMHVVAFVCTVPVLARISLRPSRP
jgi:Family of unknown function (DUF6069)